MNDSIQNDQIYGSVKFGLFVRLIHIVFNKEQVCLLIEFTIIFKLVLV